MNDFGERCYAVLRRVPSGKVVSYRQIAHAIGTKAYRAVGTAMNKNPYAPEVPCHRVVNSDGRLGGFASGPAKKRKILESEGIVVENGKIDLKKYQYSL